MFFRKKKNAHNAIEVDTQRILCDKTPFGVKEAYRTLYTNIIYLPIEDKCKKLAISSTYSGEGKTTVSINLAITIALNSPESKILLIDSDMRSPRLTSLLGYADKSLHGLSEYLVGIDEEPNVKSTDYRNLFVLPSGASNVNTPGLLSSSRFGALISNLSKEFTYIIIDTPPVGIVSDAILLNEFIDGYLLVARSDFSDINSISDTLSVFNNVEAKVYGFILSSYNAKNEGKYGKGIRYYRYGKYGKYGKYGRYSRYGKYDGGYGYFSPNKDKE